MKTFSSSILFPSLVFLFIFSACVRDKGPLDCPTLNVTYVADIKPIILANCATPGCHVKNSSAPGDYTQYSMVKFTIDAGLFQNRTFGVKDMPPSAPLPGSLLQKINCWLAAGAPDN